MRISNIKNNNSGFTLIELVIVIAGLAALGSITFPNILASLKLNKIEEAKAIMNGYAADCLGKYRISTNPVKFVEESTPDGSDETKLETLGYQSQSSISQIIDIAQPRLTFNLNLQIEKYARSKIGAQIYLFTDHHQ